MTDTQHPVAVVGEREGLAVCELRAVATALRLGGLDALRRSTITPTPTGAVLTLRAKEQETGR